MDFSLLLLLVFLTFIIAESKPNYCLPGNLTCWPTQQEINEFSSSLDGSLITSTNNESGYNFYVNMTQNALYRNQYPSFIIVCLSAKDIQLSVSFASFHNIQISICSTGHSYSGRNTANYSLQINLSSMKKHKINENNDSITVETGLQWGHIYPIVDSVNRIIVGGSDPGVGPAGYSLNGGHSPISPHYGLACDFTLEYFMVDAQSNIVHVYNTSGNNQTIDDLFWSLKGGGGSTFGVIVNITFLLHKPDDPVEENTFTQLLCIYTWYEYPVTKKNFIAEYILNNLFNLIRNKEIDENWGGYTLTLGTPLRFELAWLFYGNSTFAKQNAEPVFHLSDPYNNSANTECLFNEYNTFWEYEQTIPPEAAGFNVYLFNSLVPRTNLTQQYAHLITQYWNSSNESDGFFGGGMNAIFQAGKVNEKNIHDTAVTPAFRQNYFEVALSNGWSVTNNTNITNNAMSNGEKWELKLQPYGLGIYSNEENYECDNCDWKQQFWGTNYQKLLSVKKKWDPNNVFWCYHCVGSD